jgi:hypothetical protein
MVAEPTREIKRAGHDALSLLPRQARPAGGRPRHQAPRPEPPSPASGTAACFGELIHLDGSRQRWLALAPDTYQTLVAVIDDATKQLLYAELVAGGESTVAIMTAPRAVLTTHGIPGALYTDRAHWAVHSPTSGSALAAGARPQ